MDEAASIGLSDEEAAIVADYAVKQAQELFRGQRPHQLAVDVDERGEPRIRRRWHVRQVLYRGACGKRIVGVSALHWRRRGGARGVVERIAPEGRGKIYE